MSEEGGRQEGGRKGWLSCVRREGGRERERVSEREREANEANEVDLLSSVLQYLLGNELSIRLTLLLSKGAKSAAGLVYQAQRSVA